MRRLEARFADWGAGWLSDEHFAVSLREMDDALQLNDLSALVGVPTAGIDSFFFTRISAVPSSDLDDGWCPEEPRDQRAYVRVLSDRPRTPFTPSQNHSFKIHKQALVASAAAKAVQIAYANDVAAAKVIATAIAHAHAPAIQVDSHTHTSDPLKCLYLGTATPFFLPRTCD